MGIVVRELFAEFGAKYQMRLLAGDKQKGCGKKYCQE